MRKRTVNNRELDAIGQKLFGAAKLSETEIDRIASSRDLFSGVINRIAGHGRVERPGLGLSFFWRRARWGVACAATLLLATFTVILLRQGSGSGELQGSFDLPVETPPAVLPDHTAHVTFIKGFTQGRADILAEVTEAPVVVNAVQREYRRPIPRPQRASYTHVPEQPEFVAVTYTGDGGESARDGRVVRVDIPRSTLFAMGFNVSLENASPTVKADLLIGPDGVTRAVRLVE